MKPAEIRIENSISPSRKSILNLDFIDENREKMLKDAFESTSFNLLAKIKKSETLHLLNLQDENTPNKLQKPSKPSHKDSNLATPKTPNKFDADVIETHFYDGGELCFLDSQVGLLRCGPRVRVFNVDQGSLFHIESEHHVDCIASHPRSRSFAVAEGGKTPQIRLFSISGERLCTIKEFPSSLSGFLALCFSPDGDHLIALSCCSTFTLLLFDVQTQELLSTYENAISPPSSSIHAVVDEDFSPYDPLISVQLTCKPKKRIDSLYNFDKYTIAISCDGTFLSLFQVTTEDREDKAESKQWHFVPKNSERENVKPFNNDLSLEPNDFSIVSKFVHCWAQKGVYVGDQNGILHYFPHAKTSSLVIPHKEYRISDNNRITGIVCTKMSIFISVLNGNVHLFDVEKETIVKSYEFGGETVRLCVEPTYEKAYVCTLESAIYSINIANSLEDLSTNCVLQSHSDIITGVVALHNDSYYSTCSLDGTLRVWNVSSRTSSCECVINHSHPQTTLAVASVSRSVVLQSPDSAVTDILAVGSLLGTLRFYAVTEPFSTALIWRQRVHSNAIDHIVFSPTHSLCVVIDNSGSVCFISGVSVKFSVLGYSKLPKRILSVCFGPKVVENTLFLSDCEGGIYRMTIPSSSKFPSQNTLKVNTSLLSLSLINIFWSASDLSIDTRTPVVGGKVFLIACTDDKKIKRFQYPDRTSDPSEVSSTEITQPREEQRSGSIVSTLVTTRNGKHTIALMEDGTCTIRSSALSRHTLRTIRCGDSVSLCTGITKEKEKEKEKEMTGDETSRPFNVLKRIFGCAVKGHIVVSNRSGLALIRMPAEEEGNETIETSFPLFAEQKDELKIIANTEESENDPIQLNNSQNGAIDEDKSMYDSLTEQLKSLRTEYSALLEENNKLNELEQSQPDDLVVNLDEKMRLEKECEQAIEERKEQIKFQLLALDYATYRLKSEFWDSLSIKPLRVFSISNTTTYVSTFALKKLDEASKSLRTKLIRMRKAELAEFKSNHPSADLTLTNEGPFSTNTSERAIKLKQLAIKIEKEIEIKKKEKDKEKDKDKDKDKDNEGANIETETNMQKEEVESPRSELSEENAESKVNGTDLKSSSSGEKASVLNELTLCLYSQFDLLFPIRRRTQITFLKYLNRELKEEFNCSLTSFLERKSNILEVIRDRCGRVLSIVGELNENLRAEELRDQKMKAHEEHLKALKKQRIQQQREEEMEMMGMMNFVEPTTKKEDEDEDEEKEETAEKQTSDEKEKIPNVLDTFEKDCVISLSLPPSLCAAEIADSILQVDPSEMKAVKPASGKDIGKERLSEGAQEEKDAHTRALKVMMGGRLDGHTEDLQNTADKLKPDWMVLKDTFTEEEKKLIKEWEKKQKAQKEERLKHRKALETEARKLVQSINDIVNQFDESLRELARARLTIEAKICLNDLQAIKLTSTLMEEEDIERKHKLIIERVKMLSQQVLKVQSVVSELTELLRDAKTKTETKTQLDRNCERIFKRDFEFAGRDDLLRIYRFRKSSHSKKSQQTVIQLATGDPFDWSAENDHLNEEQTDFSADLFERPSDIDETDWFQLLKHRSEKIEAETELKKAVKVEKQIAQELQRFTEHLKAARAAQNEAEQQKEYFVDQLRKFHLDTEMLFMFKQGQIEVPQASVVTNYDDSVLLDMQHIENLNTKIRVRSQNKVGLLKEIKNVKRKLTRKRWECVSLDMHNEDLQSQQTFLQLLRVTKNLQAHLGVANDDDGKPKPKNVDPHAQEVAVLTRRAQHSSDVYRAKIKDINKQLLRIEHQCEEKEAENKDLDSHLMLQKTGLNERDRIAKVQAKFAAPSHGDTRRLKETLTRSDMSSKIKEQNALIDELREEVIRLRKKTYPIFDADF